MSDSKVIVYGKNIDNNTFIPVAVSEDGSIEVTTSPSPLPVTIGGSSAPTGVGPFAIYQNSSSSATPTAGALPVRQYQTTVAQSGLRSTTYTSDPILTSDSNGVSKALLLIMECLTLTPAYLTIEFDFGYYSDSGGSPSYYRLNQATPPTFTGTGTWFYQFGFPVAASSIGGVNNPSYYSGPNNSPIQLPEFFRIIATPASAANYEIDFYAQWRGW